MDHGLVSCSYEETDRRNGNSVRTPVRKIRCIGLAAAAHLGGGAALLDVQAAGLEEAGGGDLVEPRDGAGVQVLPQLAAAGQLLRRRGTRRGHVVRRRAVPAREQGLVVGQPEATRLIAMQ